MLTVDVISFSYKKGYPESSEDNGGGFVFDCRFLNNPGRHEEYKKLTGMDTPVKDFLHNHSNIDRFLEHVWEIVDEAVENYRERGFTSLQVAFGCTGGQHRSVFSAEETARHILERYPDVGVNLLHREQTR